MFKFTDAVAKEKDGLFKKTYEILARSETKKNYVADGSSQRSHSLDDIREIQAITYDHILASRLAAGENVQSLDTFREEMKLKKPFTADGFFNPMTKTGTMDDPTMSGQASIPLSISPFEATSIYSSGGLAEIIINKKGKGILLNGYSFKSEAKDFWTAERLADLHVSAEKTGIQNYLSNTIRDGLIYGGAMLYPVFKKDKPVTFELPLEQLYKLGVCEKDSIAYWVSVDRWNTTFIPNYNVTAQDFMMAKSYYVPLSGLEVSTSRSAVVRPKQLPYWGAIRQLGWGVSDFEGYMRSIIGYEMSIASIPLMAQQMSLLLYEMPLDTLLAQVGLDDVKKLMAENSNQMKSWSMANPKVLNAFGKVYTVNRQYTGYPDLMLTMRQDIAAQSGIPESVLFHTQPKGFSNNTEEVLLKQSETVKLSQQAILPTLEGIKNILIANAFGTDSDEFKRRDEVHFNFDTPVVATDSERAETAARYTAAINSAKQAGIPTKYAVQLVSQFFKDIVIPEDLIATLSTVDEVEKKTQDISVAQQEANLEQTVANIQVTEQQIGEGANNETDEG